MILSNHINCKLYNWYYYSKKLITDLKNKNRNGAILFLWSIYVSKVLICSRQQKINRVYIYIFKTHDENLLNAHQNLLKPQHNKK